jgi:hypothetical protein
VPDDVSVSDDTEDGRGRNHFLAIPANVPLVTVVTHRLHTYWQVREDAAVVRRRIAELGELEKIMRTALAESSARHGGPPVPPDAVRLRGRDRGWTTALPIDAGTDVALVLAEAPRRGRWLLDAYNRRRFPEARMRIGASFAIGPWVDAPSGLTGSATRQAEALGGALPQSPDAPFVTVLSGALYEQYVVPGFRFDLVPQDFREVEVDGMRAWLHSAMDIAAHEARELERETCPGTHGRHSLVPRTSRDGVAVAFPSRSSRRTIWWR